MAGVSQQLWGSRGWENDTSSGEKQEALLSVWGSLHHGTYVPLKRLPPSHKRFYCQVAQMELGKWLKHLERIIFLNILSAFKDLGPSKNNFFSFHFFLFKSVWIAVIEHSLLQRTVTSMKKTWSQCSRKHSLVEMNSHTTDYHVSQT